LKKKEVLGILKTLGEQGFIELEKVSKQEKRLLHVLYQLGITDIPRWFLGDSLGCCLKDPVKLGILVVFLETIKP